MNVLLDTHAFLWYCDGNSAFSPDARAVIEDPGNVIHISHVSAWETSIKASLGKLTLSVPFKDLFPGAVAANGFHALPPEYRHFERLLALPFHHRDPFDRLLIAQALSDELTIVTRDSVFSKYGVDTAW